MSSNDECYDDLKRQVLGIVAQLEERDNAWKDDLLTHGKRTDDDRGADELGAYDYLADVLDIEYVIGSDKEYLGARVLVAFGGPNIWIDTRRGIVDGHWYETSFSKSFDDVMGIDECLRELYECTK